MAAAALALIVANSPLAGAYADTLHAYVGGLSVLHWINDGLMAVFFLMVGLEIKREVLDGQLSTWSRRILPVLPRLGGMAGPAADLPGVQPGPGRRTPAAGQFQLPPTLRSRWACCRCSAPGCRSRCKVFLTALAIIDDLGAVIIIALFYTSVDQPSGARRRGGAWRWCSSA